MDTKKYQEMIKTNSFKESIGVREEKKKRRGRIVILEFNI